MLLSASFYSVAWPGRRKWGQSDAPGGLLFSPGGFWVILGGFPNTISIGKREPACRSAPALSTRACCPGTAHRGPCPAWPGKGLGDGDRAGNLTSLNCKLAGLGSVREPERWSLEAGAGSELPGFPS